MDARHASVAVIGAGDDIGAAIARRFAREGDAFFAGRRGAVAAESDGRLPAYVEAMMRHMWAESKKMDDPAVVRAALDASGLDGARLLARTQDADVKQALLANTERAVARGAFGLPTFFVGDEIYFGRDRRREVEEEIVRVQRTGAA